MKDWQEYSLETFERDWLGPRRKPSASMGSSTSSDANALHLSFLLALSSFSRGTHQSPHSFAPAPIGVIHRPLQNVLRAEGRCWYLLGRDLGYFPDRELPEPPADNIDAEFFFTNSEKVAAERSGVLTLETFAMWLAEAREDLTVARIAFLRLLLFAPTAEWEHELEAVRRLASFLSRRPWAAVSPVTVDSVSWALSGAELARDAERTPAFWRMDVRALNEASVPGVVSNSGERWTALEQARAPIKSAMEWLVDDEQGAFADLDGEHKSDSAADVTSDARLEFGDE
jgi:hypothetical protein